MTTAARAGRLLLALASIAVGVLLVLRPFASVPWTAAALAVGLLVYLVAALLRPEDFS